MPGVNQQVVRNFISDLQVAFHDLTGDHEYSHSIGHYLVRILDLKVGNATPAAPAYNLAKFCYPDSYKTDQKAVERLTRHREK